MRDWRRGLRLAALAGDPAPVHASDPEARDLPGAAADQASVRSSRRSGCGSRTGCCLLARMAILALMALALARPSLYSQVPLGSESQPTALGLVFDTSLSMGYIEKDKTRLDEAKERASEIVSKLPDSSLVFVVDSAEPPVPVGRSPSAALKRIDELTIRPVNRPLNAAMGQVYPAVAECDRPLRVVYVLTDLGRTSWNAGAVGRGARPGREAQDEQGLADRHVHPGRRCQGDRSTSSVESAEPSSSVATQGEPVEIRGRIRSQGAKPTTRVVEF